MLHDGAHFHTVQQCAATCSSDVATRVFLLHLRRFLPGPDSAARAVLRMSATSTQPITWMNPGPEPQPLRQIRETTSAMLAEGHTDEALDYTFAALAAVLRKVTDLELQLLKLRRERVGIRSEQVSAEQLALLLESMQQLEPVESVKKSEAEAREDAELDETIEEIEKAKREAKARGRPRTRGWHVRSAERRVHKVPLPAEERTCTRCGGEKRRLGVDITRQLEYVPAHFIENEYHLEKYACGRCKNAVSTAPTPPKVIERSDADATVLAHIVVSKYADHTPLHRVHRIYKRSGVELPVSTLADWVAGVADRLRPLADILTQRVRRAYVIGTDATGIKVLAPKISPENVERGTMWCYVGDDQDVVFHFTPTGEGETGPWAFLAGRTGYIQADAASVFDRLYNGQAASAIEVGCWAHARRKFVAIAETDSRVAYALQLIRRLYRLEYLADLKELTPTERQALRAERTADVLDRLKRWLIVTAEREPPSSDLALAAGYCLRHWTALTRFLEDGRLAPDNNNCEQQMRDIALGRRNFLFAGSHNAAYRAATLYSLMRTCAQHHVPPLPYLTDVLRKLAAGWPDSRLEELLPDQWQHLHGKALTAPAAQRRTRSLSR